MGLYIKENGSWVSPSSVWVKENGSWVQIKVVPAGGNYITTPRITDPTPDESISTLEFTATEFESQSGVYSVYSSTWEIADSASFDNIVTSGEVLASVADTSQWLASSRGFTAGETYYVRMSYQGRPFSGSFTANSQSSTAVPFIYAG